VVAEWHYTPKGRSIFTHKKRVDEGEGEMGVGVGDADAAAAAAAGGVSLTTQHKLTHISVAI